MSRQKILVLQQIVKGSGFLLVGHIIAFFVGFLYQILVARYLGPESFGVLSLGIVLMGVGSILVKLGLPQGLSRFVAFYSAKKDYGRVKGTLLAGFVILMVSSVVVVSLGLLFSGFIADTFFHSSDYLSLIRIFVLAIPFAALINVLYELFLGFRRPLSAVIIETFLHKTLRLVITVLFILLGTTVFGLSVIYLTGLIIAAVMGFVILRNIFPAFFSKFRGLTDYHELARFSAPLFFSAFLGLVFGWGDSLMIGYFLEPAEVGVYRVAFSLAAFLNIFIQSFGSIIYPLLTGFLAKKSVHMIKMTYSTVSRLIFLITLPFFFLFIFFSSQIIHLFYGIEYASGGISLAILSTGYILSVFVGPANKLIQVFGHTKFLFKIQAFNVLLNLALNILMIPIFGIAGAALTTALTTSLASAFCLFRVRRLANVKFDKLPYVKYVFSGMIAMFLVLVTRTFIPVHNILLLALVALLFLILYSVLLVLFRSFDKDDLILIRATEEKLGLKRHLISKWIKV